MSETDVAIEDGAESPERRPGRLLAEARTQKNLSVVEVAQQLKLSTGQVEALEADAYERLPGPVFVRGFVRNYARLVELDGDALVAVLSSRQETGPAGATVPHSHNIPFPEQRPARWRGYLAGFLIILSAVALFEIFFSAPQSVVVVAPPPVDVTPASPAPAQMSAPDSQVPAPATATAEAELQKPDAVAATAAPAPAPVSVTAPVAAQKETADLHFVFADASWVEVRDRNDRPLFSQLNPAGTEQHVQGRLPLSVVVGNATGVRLTYNGQSFDLAPHTRVAVARFTLE